MSKFQFTVTLFADGCTEVDAWANAVAKLSADPEDYLVQITELIQEEPFFECPNCGQTLYEVEPGDRCDVCETTPEWVRHEQWYPKEDK